MPVSQPFADATRGPLLDRRDRLLDLLATRGGGKASLGPLVGHDLPGFAPRPRLRRWRDNGRQKTQRAGLRQDLRVIR
eukprot:8325999-Pyramimonas_sp.AAC.1